MTRDQSLAFVVTVAVLVALALGVRAIGNPREARQHRLDGTRVEALERISAGVNLYHQRHGRLPENLQALREFSNVRLQDPDTGAPFEYRATGEQKYELCATFARHTREDAGTTFWSHPAGRHCFDLAVRSSC
jgi:hypothetical protein